MTDFRYSEQAEAEVAGWEVVMVSGESLGASPRARGTVGFDDDRISVREHDRLAVNCPTGVELVPAGGTGGGSARGQGRGGDGGDAAAAELTDAIYRWSSSGGWPGAPSARSRSLSCADGGARRRALFPPIVAAGPNGALPHAEPRDAEIPRASWS